MLWSEISRSSDKPQAAFRENFAQSIRSFHERAIIAQRNVLAHQYGDIDFVRIWRVATVDVPELIRVLDPLIGMPPSGE